MHFTDLVEEGILLRMGKPEAYSWYLLPPDIRELTKAFAEFMPSEQDEVHSSYKYLMRVVLCDFAARKIAAKQSEPPSP